MSKKNGRKSSERASDLTDQETTGLLSALKNAGQGGNAKLHKKVLDAFIKKGGIDKLLEK